MFQAQVMKKPRCCEAPGLAFNEGDGSDLLVVSAAVIIGAGIVAVTGVMGL
jgi:hypothetical protein